MNLFVTEHLVSSYESVHVLRSKHAVVTSAHLRSDDFLLRFF